MTDELSNRDSAQAANSDRHLAAPSNGFLTARTAGAAALMFANWSEAEAAERISKLLAAGWSAAQIGRMFGLRIEEIDRLTRSDVVPEKDCAHVG